MTPAPPPPAPPPSPPLVSIVIINWNYGRFLDAAVASALAQDHAPLEVVVVDDGSTDDSRARIAAWGDRIRAVLQENAGHTRAANAGAAAARGDYVLFLDADDLLEPDCVSAALAAIRPGDAKLQFRLATIDAEGRDAQMPFPYFPPAYSPEDVLAEALSTGWHPWTVSTGNLYARWFLDALMPIDAARIYRSPDGYLNKLAPLYGPVRSLPRVLGAYRVHGSNAWASKGSEWSVGVALRWLKFNIVLEQAFHEAATRQGVRVREPLLHPFQKLEYEMLAARFATPRELADLGSHAPDRFGVLRAGWAWLLRLHPNGWRGSAIRFGWLLALALAPPPLARAMVSKARTQAGRGVLWSSLLALTRPAVQPR